MSNSIEQVRTPEIIANEIKGYTAMMLTNVIEIGRRMCEVKELLPHGSFGSWIKENTGYSVSTANNFMRLFNEYADAQFSIFGAEVNSQTLGNLGYTKALELLALPASEREEFVEEHDVESMSTRELKEAIRERDEAKKRAEALEAEVNKLSDNLKSAEEDLSEAEEELSRAREALEKPIEAVVTATDAAEIDKAVEKAVSEASKVHAAEIEEFKKKLEASAKEKDKLEKKLDDANKKAQAVADKSADAGEQTEKYKKEAEELRQKLAMADPITAEFKGLFEQASVIITKLVHLVGQAPESSAPNLQAALAALGKQFGGAGE